MLHALMDSKTNSYNDIPIDAYSLSGFSNNDVIF